MRVRIRELVKDAGISKARLARKLNVSYMTVCNWDSGRKFPSMASAKGLIEILKCKPEDLLGS